MSKPDCVCPPSIPPGIHEPFCPAAPKQAVYAALFPRDENAEVAEIIAHAQRETGPKELELFDDAVAFRQVDADRTDAGLYVPQKGENAEARKKGIVVAVGPGRLREDGRRDPMPLQPGDHIVCWPEAPPIHGTSFTGEVLFLVRARDVACRVVPRRGGMS